MEDYRHKIEKLSLERLNSLAAAYRATIQNLEERHKMATLVAMMKDAEFTERELGKKRTELAEIEKIILNYNK